MKGGGAWSPPRVTDSAMAARSEPGAEPYRASCPVPGGGIGPWWCAGVRRFIAGRCLAAAGERSVAERVNLFDLCWFGGGDARCEVVRARWLLLLLSRLGEGIGARGDG